MRALVALILAVALAGCNTTPPAPIVLAAPVVAEQPLAERIPAKLLADQPEPPAAAIASNEDAARYIVGLRAWGRRGWREKRALVKVIKSEAGR